MHVKRAYVLVRSSRTKPWDKHRISDISKEQISISTFLLRMKTSLSEQDNTPEETVETPV